MVKPEEFREQVTKQMQSVCEKETTVICEMYKWVYEATVGMPEEQRDVIVEQSLKVLFGQMEESAKLMQDSLKQAMSSGSLDKLIKKGDKDARL